jgi:hypothetical protein
MGLLIYGLGRDLSYDLGYQLGSSHVQTSWARHTASHNLVVVNEKSQMVVPSPGGDARFYVDAAPVRAFEASDPSCYKSENVSDYRRTVALVDAGGGSYTVDVFRVSGGNKHDLMWHFCGDQEGVEGTDMGPVQAEGSLAGPDIDWGRKLGAGGDLIGCSDKPPYWNAPPGNGYGFLYNVRTGKNPADCRLTWKVGDSGQKIVAHLMPEPGSELVTARAPGILPEWPQADYAILRRQGSQLNSTFVSVIEPVSDRAAIRSVARFESGGATCIRVESDAGVDYVLSAPNPAPVTFHLPGGESVSFDGRFGFVRIKNGAAKRSVLVEGTELVVGPARVTAECAERIARVETVDLEGASVTLDAPLSGLEQGSYVYISRPDYSHGSVYRVASWSDQSATFDAGFVIARGQVAADDTGEPDLIRSEVPMPRSIDMWSRPNGYLAGKTIRNERTGRCSTIVDVVKDQYTIRLKDPSALSPGDRFTIYDVQPGDVVRVPSVIVK